jgi:serine/threonine protein kinase
MGVVYEGLDPILERRVALKTIRKDLLHASDAGETQNMLQRFRREAQAAARLHHPNVVVVYDYAEQGDTVFIAMELVRGRELKDFFKQKHPFDLKSALEIMLQLLDGLGYSHQHNIVHRDIKPANIILLDESGQVKITDFGVAHIDSSELTQAGEIMGTPTHMAPEQLMGQPVDGRADLFSAGVIFYQLLTGERPFGGGSIVAVMHNVLSSEPPAPTQLNPALPPECDAIIRKALAKRADDRYQDAAAFAQALKALLQQAGTAAASTAQQPSSAQAAVPAPRAPQIPPELLPAAPVPPRHDMPATLEGWVEFLTTQEMPIFSHTARRINQVMNAPSASAMELGRIIQQDPSLTAKLLKLGNSAYYNPSRQKLPNISRAVIILGVKTIYNLAIACSYVESASSGANTDDVNRQIAKSIHTAVQAKSFATLADDPYPEEIFVAALMNNFGRVAFWCYGKTACSHIRKLTQAGMADEEAERTVLGFTLRELDGALCKHWKLGGLIEECQAELSPSTSDRAKLVYYSHQLVDHLEQGLDSEEVQDSLHRIAEIIEHSVSALEPIVNDNAEQAVGVASQLGAGGGVARYIVKPAATAALPPPPPPPPLLPAPRPRPAAGRAASRPSVNVSVDQMERTRTLQDISAMLNEKIEINSLVDRVMDGIMKILHMDRVLLTLVNQQRTAVREKTSKGILHKTRNSLLEFDISREKNLFSKALAENGGNWLIPQQDMSARKLFTPKVAEQLGQHECFLMPITVNHKSIGLFYADRALSRAPLDRDAFNVFVELVQQANIGLNLATKQH